jgi:hypothetical protein
LDNSGYNINTEKVLTLAALTFALYAGGSASYVLGVAIILPSSVATLINSTTIVHLTSQLTFMAVFVFALFKVSRLIVVGMAFFGQFLICKFYFGPKRPGGLRHPTVNRLQRRMYNAVVEGRSYSLFIFWVRIIIVTGTCLLTFFSFASTAIVTQPKTFLFFSTVLLMPITAIFGSMFAYRVHKRTLKEFFSSSEGRKLVVVTTLFVCMVLGMARTLAMMQGPTVFYSLGPEFCQLAPMMPVYGGNLYFDRQSSNFVIMSSNKIAFYIPHRSSQMVPICI